MVGQICGPDQMLIKDGQGFVRYKFSILAHFLIVYIFKFLIKQQPSQPSRYLNRLGNTYNQLLIIRIIRPLIYLKFNMQNRKTGKRGRPANKKPEESDEESQSYSHKPKKKLTKKDAEPKKKDPQSKKAKSKIQLSSVDSFSDSDDNSRKTFKVPVEVFSSGQVYAEILNKANRDPEFLIMLKNLLSGCSRLREQKKSQYRKKWKMLRNSNCTQNEYLSRQSELKRMEAQQVGEIEDDIISKLALANIRGFETRESIVNNFKLSQQNIDQNIEYVIDETQWNKYREEQKKLLQIVMNENDFVSQDYKMINLNTKHPSETPNVNAIIKEEENEMQLKFNNLETEENQESIQFLFCKNYNNINYQKVFDSSYPFKVSQDEKYMIDSKAMSWLLQSKCDQIYTNDQFQQETYTKYSEMLAKMYDHPENFTQTQIMNNVLEAGAYILNSVHYYQKFKLKCELLHPLDLLLVADKITKDRNKRLAMKEEMVAEPHEAQAGKPKVENSQMVDEGQEGKI